MADVDIKPLLVGLNMTPESGAEAVKGGQQFEIDPDVFNQLKTELQPEMEAAKLPDKVAPNLANAIKSQSIAAVIKPDLKKLNYAEKHIENFAMTLKSGDIGRQANQVAFDMMMNGPDDNKTFDLIRLRSEVEDIETQRQELGFNFGENIPANVANIATDYVRGLRDNAKEAAIFAGISTASGAGVGLFTAGPAAALAGGIGGAVTGLRYGPRIAGFKDSLTQSSGGVYSELTFGKKEVKDQAGNISYEDFDLPENEKQNVSIGAGFIVAALDLVGEQALLKTVPWLAKIASPKAFAKYISKAENQALLNTAKKIGSSEFVRNYLAGAGAEGLTEAVQEVVEQLAVTSTTSSQEGYQAFVDGLLKINYGQAAEAGALGAIAGTGFTAVGRGVGKLLPEKPKGPPPPPVDNTPKVEIADNIGLTDRYPKGITENGYKSVQVAQAVAELALVTKDTKFKELTPDQFKELMQRQVEQAGIPSMYVDPDEVTAWADNEEKAAAVKAVLDTVGLPETSMNTPIRINTEDAVAIESQFEGFASLLKIDPADITHNQYRQIVDQRKARAREILDAGISSRTLRAESTPIENQGEELLTQQEISPRQLTPEEQTLVDARGDLYLKDIKNKDLSDQELTDMVVTRERAQYVIDEIQEEINDLTAFKNIELAKSASTDAELTQLVKDAESGSATIKDGRTVVFTPSIQANGIPIVTATVDGQFAGSVKMHLERQNKKNVTAPAFTLVDEKFRRKGVATAMYEYIRQKVVRMEHSNIQLPDGKAFTQASRKKGTGVFKVPDTEKLTSTQQRLQLLQPKLPSYNDGRIRDADIKTERQYLNQSIFTKEIEGVLPQAEVDRLNEAVQQARLTQVEAIDLAADREWTEIVDFVTQLQQNIAREEQAAAIENDPNIELVENFINGKIIGVPTPEMKEKQAKKIPMIQINPDSLPQDLKNKYGDDEVLKKRKVFSKKGMHIDEAMRYFDVTEREQFLNILSTTPDRNQAIKNAAALRLPQDQAEAEANTPLNETAISKFYDDTSARHVAEMQVLKDKEWPTLKSAIKRIALPMPKISEIVEKSRQAILKTPVKFLNARRYTVGEGKSQAKAVRDVLAGRFESAFANKQAALLNNQLAKFSHGAIKAVNKANKKIVAVMSEAGQNQLQEAGMLDPVNYILDTFNFDPSKKNTTTEEMYRKFQEQMIAQGKGDFRIPEGLAAKLTGKVDARNLSVEEYIFLADKMYHILTEARRKNQLTDQYARSINEQNIIPLRETVNYYMTKHRKYDETKSLAGVKPRGVIETFGNWVSAGLNNMKNLQSILIELDDGKKDGYFQRMIFDALEGIGFYNDGVNGTTAAVAWRAELQTRYKAALKKYGASKFRSMHQYHLEIPEFASNAYLNYGRMTKGELFTLATHVGNLENRERILNFGVDIDTVMTVLERELDTADMDFIQENIWNEYENMKPRLAAKERQSKGSEPKWTEAKSFTFRGKEYRGGYMPIKYNIKGDGRAATQAIKEQMKAANGETIRDVTYVEPLHGLVYAPHTEERTGSNWILSLNPTTIQQGFEDVIYDVTMRDPVKYTREILTDKSIAKDIQNVIGVEKYNLLLSQISELTKSYNSYQIDLYNAQNAWLKRFTDVVQAGTSVAQIAYRLPSLAIQLASYRYAIDALGFETGPKYLAKTFQQILNPWATKEWKNALDFAATIDPAIAAYYEGLDNTTSNMILKLSPHDRALKDSGKYVAGAYNLLRNIQQNANDFAFEKILGGVDVMTKTLVVIAAYNQYMNADAPDQNVEQFYKMSDQEKIQAAKAYAARLARSTMTAGSMIDRAAIQKTPTGMIFARYFNDARNALNYNLQRVGNMRSDARKAIAAAKAKDYDTFNKHFTDLGEDVMKTFILSTAAIIFAKSVRGMFLEDEEEENELLPKDDESPAAYLGRMTFKYGNELYGQNTPIIRDLTYGIDTAFGKDRQTPRVQPPIMSAFTALAITGKETLEVGYGLANGLTLYEAIEGISEKDAKQMGLALSVVTGGIPVNAAFDYYKLFADPDSTINWNPLTLMAGLFGATMDVASDFVERNDTEEDDFTATFNRLKALEDNPDSLEGVVEEAKLMVSQATSTTKEDLTDDEYFVLKMAESNGKWNARPKKFEKDPETGEMDWDGEYLSNAFGYYQFLPSTWQYIVDNAPKNLGLTKSGLYLPGGKQQETAMRWWVKDIVRQFKTADVDIPVNAENIYGAHHFGPQGWIKVMEADESKSIKSVLGEKVLKANPQIKRRGYKTVKDLKQYIVDQLDIARSKVAQN